MAPRGVAQVQEVMASGDVAGMHQGEPPLRKTVLAVFPVREPDQIRVEVVRELVEKDRVVVGILHPQPVPALVAV